MKKMLLSLIAILVLAPAGSGKALADEKPPQGESSVTTVEADTANPKFLHPVFKTSGGVVTPKGSVLQPQAGMKALFDITRYDNPAEIVKGLDRVALNLNLAKLSGVASGQVKFAVVLHGDATKVALNNEAYAKATGVLENPNLPLIRRLHEHGVELYICLQALAHQKLPAQAVATEFHIASSAVVVLIRKQNEGYAFLPF